MTTKVEKYMEETRYLLAAQDGNADDSVEDEILDKLDTLWWELSEEEKQEVNDAIRAIMIERGECDPI